MNAVYECKISPFRNKLENINTAGRIIFISRKSLDINFTYQELRSLMHGFGYEEIQKGKTSGSRVAFVHPKTKHNLLHL